jgi:hypothetical protein
MHLVCQDMLQYQATQVNMAQNLQALHSTVQEVANAMASMTLKLNQFCFPAALSLPASTPPTLQEVPPPAQRSKPGLVTIMRQSSVDPDDDHHLDGSTSSINDSDPDITQNESQYQQHQQHQQQQEQQQEQQEQQEQQQQ